MRQVLAFAAVMCLGVGCADEPESRGGNTGLDAETESRALATLREGLLADAFWPSMHAAEGLTLAGYGSEVVEHLGPMLDESGDSVTDARERCGVARELARAGDSTAIRVLVDVLRDADPYAHTHAAESLYKLGRVGDMEAMRRVYAAEDVKLRLMAAGALARFGDDKALQVIRETYATGDEEAIQIGAWLLGRIGGSQDIDLLKTRLDDIDGELVRAYVDHALATLGDDESLEVLIANLSSPDPAIRTYAATFAGDTRQPALVRHLVNVLDDPHADARYRAAQSLLVLSRQQQHEAASPS